MTAPYPKTPSFMTIDEPFRFEGSLYDAEVEGKIPAELDGTFYCVGPDQAFPPRMGDANPFNGDGFARAFRIKDGHCDVQLKYVMTHRLKAERAARRGLFGDYRNAFTDDPSVKGVQRTVSNTNLVPHAGQLLAMKEAGYIKVDDEIVRFAADSGSAELRPGVRTRYFGTTYWFRLALTDKDGGAHLIVGDHADVIVFDSEGKIWCDDEAPAATPSPPASGSA